MLGVHGGDGVGARRGQLPQLLLEGHDWGLVTDHAPRRSSRGADSIVGSASCWSQRASARASSNEERWSRRRDRLRCHSAMATAAMTRAASTHRSQAYESSLSEASAAVVVAAVGESLTSSDVWTLDDGGSEVRSITAGADSDSDSDSSDSSGVDSSIAVVDPCDAEGSVAGVRDPDGSATEGKVALTVRLGVAVTLGSAPSPPPEHAPTRSSSTTPSTPLARRVRTDLRISSPDMPSDARRAERSGNRPEGMRARRLVEEHADARCHGSSAPDGDGTRPPNKSGGMRLPLVVHGGWGEPVRATLPQAPGVLPADGWGDMP